MQPTTQTIHEIFEKERRYVVPLFQRAYVWTLEDQWEPLWEDIERQAQACLDSWAAEKETPTRHFLGAAVVNVAKVFGRGIARCEVIDGQQRLTTLQVFLAALRDYAREIDDRVAEQASRLTINPSTNSDPDQKFKVWPTNADRNVFRTVMTAGSIGAIQDNLGTGADGQRQSLPKLAEAYRYFQQAIKAYVKGTEPIDDSSQLLGAEALGERLYAIVHAMRTALQMVVIELEERDDPQVIFETLNARGQPLLPSDLIRNTIFLDAANQGKDVESLYNRYWRHFDEYRVDTPASDGEDRFWHLNQRQGRLYRPRIDLFIFHDLIVRNERIIDISHLFRAFRDWRVKASLTTEEYLASLKSRSENFARLIEPRNQDRMSVFARRLRSLDTSTVYPLLLLLMELPPERLSIEARDQILTDLESFLVRRYICYKTPKNYNNFFVGLLRQLKRAVEQKDDLSVVVRTELLRGDADTTIWPSDETFEQGWLNNPIYVKSRSDRAAMVLQALNDALHTRRSETIVLPENLTVEHLLPQQWETHYPFPEDFSSDSDEETADQKRQRLLHTLGNLTLLTGPLNTSVSNGPFKQKAKAIAQDSDLRLNAWFREDTFDSWDEGDILRRGADLFETAKLIWPYPTE